MLNEPLPWQTPDKTTDVAAEAEGEAFLNFMQQHQSRAGA